MASFRNIEESLSKHLPPDELKEVKSILYGRSDEWVLPKCLRMENVSRLSKLFNWRSQENTRCFRHNSIYIRTNPREWQCVLSFRRWAWKSSVSSIQTKSFFTHSSLVAQLNWPRRHWLWLKKMTSKCVGSHSPLRKRSCVRPESSE